MQGIFINYRREDSSAYAGRLYDVLLAHFGRDRVFMDIDAIGPGEDFREVISKTCASCKVLLAVMGRSWATLQDKNGHPRLFNETDYVRMEISSALQKDLRVIPVLVGGADMPDSNALPPDLQPLVYRNAWEISDKRFHQDVLGLVEAIKRLIDSPETTAETVRARPRGEPVVAPPVHFPPPVKIPMRPKTAKWGALVTLFYVLAVLFLIIPAVLYVGFFPKFSLAALPMELLGVYFSLITLIPFGVLVIGQALLLWLSVDTTRRKLKPRTHILISTLVVGTLLSLLSFAFYISLMAVPLAYGQAAWLNKFVLWGSLPVSWIFWAILFYRFTHSADDAVTRMVSWLFRGSVLELLIAVPAHVIVRRKDDCSAPAVTGYGIGTGIAIMLLSFGPSVLLLLKQRMDQRNPR